MQLKQFIKVYKFIFSENKLLLLKMQKQTWIKRLVYNFIKTNRIYIVFIFNDNHYIKIVDYGYQINANKKGILKKGYQKQYKVSLL